MLVVPTVPASVASLPTASVPPGCRPRQEYCSRAPSRPQSLSCPRRGQRAGTHLPQDPAPRQHAVEGDVVRAVEGQPASVGDIAGDRAVHLIDAELQRRPVRDRSAVGIATVSRLAIR